MIYQGNVYDIGKVVHLHPGPSFCIECRLGTDMTQILNQKHSGMPIERMIAKLQIGRVVD